MKMKTKIILYRNYINFYDWSLLNVVDDATLSQLEAMYDISTKSGIYIFQV